MGMGGSAIAGLIMKDISPHLEIIVERNYFPNAIIDEHTLLIICSYSGNTEESLSYYKHASSLTKNIFGITSGGKLLTLLKKAPFKHTHNKNNINTNHIRIINTHSSITKNH